MLLVKFDLKLGKSIKNKEGQGFFLEKFFKILKISIFFEKKLYLKNENLEVIQNHFLF